VLLFLWILLLYLSCLANLWTWGRPGEHATCTFSVRVDTNLTRIWLEINPGRQKNWRSNQIGCSSLGCCPMSSQIISNTPRRNVSHVGDALNTENSPACWVWVNNGLTFLGKITLLISLDQVKPYEVWPDVTNQCKFISIRTFMRYIFVLYSLCSFL
jgi:hypothetical protein